jgi:hypothetical protein
MARQESDKEDLLRHATALVERVELELLGPEQGESRCSKNVVAGFRRDGAASVFFGPDPVYHFNASGELRRAYCDGLLFKAERGNLISLRRERMQNEVRLLRHELTDTVQQSFLSRMQQLLVSLEKSLNGGAFEVVGQVSTSGDIIERLKKWLASQTSARIARSPHAGRHGR